MKASGFIRNKRSGFAQVSNTCLRDPSLSLTAKGLYSLIQSLITNTDYKLFKSSLQRDFCKEGKSAFNSAWKELINSGFLKMYKINTTDGFIYEYELLDEPEKGNEPSDKGGNESKSSESEVKAPKNEEKYIDSPDTDFPHLGNPHLDDPHLDSPDLENPSLLNNTLLSNTKKNKINKRTASEIDDPFMLPPMDFLSLRQGGLPVSAPDRKVIDYLSEQMHFSDELANVLIDHTLKKCNDMLNSNYISKVASTWIRKGIDTRQKALDFLSNNDQKASKPKKSSYVPKQMQEIPMPAYWNNRDNFNRESISDEKLKELQELQLEMAE